MDFRAHAEQLQALLGLKSRPIALAFLPAPPPGVRRVARAAASGCTYWRLAAEGGAFYTEVSDHFGCAVGAYTHGVELPAAQAKELEGLIGTMTGLGYLRPEEIPDIPTRKGAFGVLVYAPLAEAPCPPDVILVRGNARQVMLAAEAAWGAGLRGEVATMGRPACAVVPHAIQSGAGTASLGCIGNRVYTGLGDDELYFAIPGGGLGAVVERLGTIVRANEALLAFHTERRDKA
jgi:uncharacterized protein (DUF169 family)